MDAGCRISWKRLAQRGGRRSPFVWNCSLFGSVHGGISTGNVVRETTFLLESSNFIQKIVTQWMDQCESKGIPCSSNFSLNSTLGDPVVVRSWHIAGLPVDRYCSVQFLEMTPPFVV